MTQSTALPNIFTSLADTDELLVNVGGKTGRITVANAKKSLGGGSATGGSSAGSVNLFSTPENLGANSGSKFFDYQPSGELSRPGGLRLVVKSPFTGPVLLTEEVTNAKLVPNKIYTIGFTFIRAANSGSGQPYAHVDWHTNSGIPDVESDILSSVTDGVAVRVSKTFKVAAGVGNAFPGIRFNGACDVTFSKITLVEGTVDNPDAVVAA